MKLLSKARFAFAFHISNVWNFEMDKIGIWLTEFNNLGILTIII